MMAQPIKLTRSTAAVLIAILLLALIARLSWRLHMGSDDFWANGYSRLYEIATNFAAGQGLNLDGHYWAERAPLYPLFLSIAAQLNKGYLLIIVPQAVMGAATALCAYLLGAKLFNRTTGTIAALLTAIYPYYVVHDTALQETGMFNFLTALSVLLLFHARERNSCARWLLAGLALGATVLTRPTILPFALGALVWIGLFGAATRRQRISSVLFVILSFSLVVGPWLARNYVLLGAPVITSDVGRMLWVGNNPKTFTHYPSESIDLSENEAFNSFSNAERREMDALEGKELLESDWYLGKAFDYIQRHPLEAIRADIRKEVAGFSWTFSPAREPLVQTVYFLSYAPIFTLGTLGMALTWRRWREFSLIYLLFLNFVVITAVFFAHTSHRSYLDVYWIVFASHLICRVVVRMQAGFISNSESASPPLICSESDLPIQSR